MDLALFVLLCLIFILFLIIVYSSRQKVLKLSQIFDRVKAIEVLNQEIILGIEEIEKHLKGEINLTTLQELIDDLEKKVDNES